MGNLVNIGNIVCGLKVMLEHCNIVNNWNMSQFRLELMKNNHWWDFGGTTWSEYFIIL